MLETTNENASLRRRWQLLLETNPKLRIKNAADQLCVSELELVDLDRGSSATRLGGTAAALFAALPDLGEVMALTRNDAFVHERVGRYENFSAEGHVGLVVGDEIDLRIFLHHFAHAYAVTSEGPRDSRRSSLQFFDAHGRAMHKVFLREGSDHGAWARLVGRFAAQVDAGPLHVTPAPVRPAERHDSEIDVAGFRAAWLAMTDTHEFFGITRAFGVSRLQALRLAPPSHARRLATTRFSDVLRAAASSDLPIMVFVGSPGCIQIHTGPVERLVVVDGWFNVLDPRFNLHVREDLIDSAWHVTKPTADGDVNSIEYFDRDGQLLCMLFGARKPGKPERGDWRELASGAR